MRWSKLRKLLRNGFANSFVDRIDIHSAAYGNCSCGHCWITLDGEVVANFCTRAYFNLKMGVGGVNPRMQNLLVAYGEKSRQGAYASMFDFVHSIPIAEALKSSDPLIQCLAVIDSRVGKRTLGRLDSTELCELASELLRARRQAEGITAAP